MIEKMDNFIFNFLLIAILWIVAVFIFYVIKEPQIVVIYHLYPECILLFPRESIFILPIAFSFVILYNITLKFLGVKESEINKLNFLVFFIGALTEIYIFFINF